MTFLRKQVNNWHKTYDTFRPDKTYKFRGWRNRAWSVMMGNEFRIYHHYMKF